VFTSAQRERVRARLLNRASQDAHVTGAAITGSASRNAEDRWSDIDLFLGVADEIALESAIGDWSDFMYRELGALHHFDLHAASAIYRAFLLPDCLEVDLAFTPARSFGALGPAFRVVFGEAIKRPHIAPANPDHLIGLAWHHVLHARIAIERRQSWQAEYWISGVRDHALALSSLRFGQPAAYAKGADALPTHITAGLEDALVRALTVEELSRALRNAADGLLRELHQTNGRLADRLRKPLRELAGSSRR
jgi:predicted nucleotidyltransferase